MSYTDEQIRDRAVANRAELAATYGAVGADVTVSAEVDIDWARSQVGPVAFGTRTLTALALLLCHLGTLRVLQAQAGSGAPAMLVGAVQSTTVGGMTISRGASGLVGAWPAGTAAEGFLSQTIDGMAFLALRNSRAFHAPRVA